MKRLRVAVTGLSGAGKTVFLTSLINHLLEGRGLSYFESAHVSYLATPAQPRIDLPGFPYETNLEGFRRDPPVWPEGTRDVTAYAMDLVMMKTASRGPKVRRLRLEFVDYPGEWLADLPMASMSFAQWSAAVIAEAHRGGRAELSGPWLASILESDEAKWDPGRALEEYGNYLRACKEQGLVYLQPARMADSTERDVLFCPLGPGAPAEVAREFSGHYSDYIREVGEFHRKVVARCTRQIVLVDVLRILRGGTECYNETRRCMENVLHAYGYAASHGTLSPLRLWYKVRPRIERVVFTATKADQCTAATRANLKELLGQLVTRACYDLQMRGTDGLHFSQCAAHRCTSDAKKSFEGQDVSCLEGVRLDRPEEGERAWYPGEVPHEWPDDWDPETDAYRFFRYRPRRFPPRDGAVIPHINLDKIVWHLLEDIVP